MNYTCWSSFVIQKGGLLIMPDNLTKRHPEDSAKINRNQPYELDAWTKILGCSKEKLLAAIDRVGPIVSDVEKYLAQK